MPGKVDRDEDEEGFSASASDVDVWFLWVVIAPDSCFIDPGFPPEDMDESHWTRMSSISKTPSAAAFFDMVLPLARGVDDTRTL